MKRVIGCVFLFLLSVCAVPQWGHTAGDVRESVVKVYTVSVVQDYDEPWKSMYQESSQGSGCVLEGNRILTAAHLVADPVYIQVRKGGEARKYEARVKVAAHECDLALLEVEDEAFFADTRPMRLGGLADLGDEVTAYGFPHGGDKLCTTRGVVSRVEHTHYVQGGSDLLACQIDAAINPGSSGGPVVKDGVLVGIAFEGANGDNIGYMIPPPIIRHFLRDLEDGEHNGIPSLGVSTQPMESPAMRKAFGMKEDTTGVLVNRVPWGSPAQGRIEPGDVILAVAGEDVENDGSIEFRKGERTRFEYLVQQRHVGDALGVEVLRKGEVQAVDVPLTKGLNFERLVPFQRFDVTPTYYIFGGLVFEPLTENYLMTWGDKPYLNAPSKLRDDFLNGLKSRDRKEAVLLVKVLANKMNAGYHDLKNRVVSKVNGAEISCMKDLVRAFEGHEGPYHEVVDEKGYRIVLDSKEVQAGRGALMETFGIGSCISRDLD